MIRTLARAAEALNLDLVPRSVYSPVPLIPSAESATWRKRTEIPGVDLDLDAQIRWIQDDLGPYIEEFGDALSSADDFELWNGSYQAGDAEILYSMIRRLRPNRIVEIGSGNSTIVAARASAANRADGVPGEVVAIDPVPRIDLSALTQVELRPVDCRADPNLLLSLSAGDVLFIDSSHMVKLNSEVNWLILEILPRLSPGVHVHFHDIFLPYEYPRYLFELGAMFNEQYLLAGLLTENERWSVTIALACLFFDRRDALIELIPSLAEDPPGLTGFGALPAAFWMTRR